MNCFEIQKRQTASGSLYSEISFTKSGNLIKFYVCDNWTCHDIELNKSEIGNMIKSLKVLYAEMQ